MRRGALALAVSLLLGLLKPVGGAEIGSDCVGSGCPVLTLTQKPQLSEVLAGAELEGDRNAALRAQQLQLVQLP